MTLYADDILRATIADNRCVYVFPTEIAASAWADRALEITDAQSVALDRFIAWDTFKSDSIRSQKQQKRSIPSVLRKLFAERLIAENARLVKTGEPPLFRSIINPQYAQTASSFTEWIAGLLPSLGPWYERFVRESEGDSEDGDLLTLTRRYEAFLEEHRLFEPAWEKPPFKADGKTYYIFYPEILTDFFEYEKLLESARNVELIRINGDLSDGEAAAEERGTRLSVAANPSDTAASPDTASSPRVHCFGNSRAELAAVVRKMKELHDRGLAWNDISVNIADMETYAPYLERECELHSIPCVRRAGKPLSSYAAGTFFKTVWECVSRQFPFDEVRKLLLDKNLPWKDGESIDQLIAFGKKNNCLCSWREGDVQIDVWEQAFRSAAAGREERARTFYTLLKKELSALTAADSFERIRSRYFSFRERFFDMTLCTPLADKVLGRCVSELLALVDIENTYPTVKPEQPFSFFVRYLADKIYLPRQETQGVNLLPYRAAAGAAAGCHIVVGASQKTLSVTVKQLGFLREDKRKRLALVDADLSASFIRLYDMHSADGNAYFTFAENSFGGYAIPHSALAQAEPDPAEPDAYGAEAEWFADPDGTPFPERLYPVQKTGFFNWSAAAGVSDEKDRRTECTGENPSARRGSRTAVPEAVRARLYAPIDGGTQDAPSRALRVSVTDLHAYYECPVKWLFSRIFGLESFSLDAELTAANTTGVLYHTVLERFFSAVKADPQTKGTLPPLANGQMPENCAQIVRRELNAVLAETERNGSLQGNAVSIIGAELLRARERALEETLRNCLRAFLSYFAGHIVSEVETAYSFVHREENGFASILNGRLDLVLVEPETDAPVIIDFKTNGTPNAAECAQLQLQQSNSVKTYELKNYQMAMYTLLYEHAHPGIAVEKTCFFSVVEAEPTVVTGSITDDGGRKKPYRDSLVVSREAFEPSILLLQEKISSYVRAVAAAEPVSAAGVAYKTCGGCPYRHVCRTRYSVSGNRQEDIRI